MTFARWVNRNRDWILPSVAIVLMLVVVFGLRGIVERQHQSNTESCERSNVARVAFIHNLQGDVHSLRAELNLWTAAQAHSPPAAQAETPPAVLAAFNENLAAIRLAIHRKTTAIEGSISAQASVAVKPGSPVVDCTRAYP